MKRLILPVVYPIITHTPPTANLLSIIGTNPMSKEWIFNNYVNIYLDFNVRLDNFFNRYNFFYDCPWVFEDHISRNIVKKSFSDISKFFLDLISDHHYVYVMVNTKHINAYNQNFDRDHNLMIYGFDSEDKNFYIADFFRDGKYSFETCSFTEMEASFYDDSRIISNWYDVIRMLKLKKVSYSFNKHTFQQYLEDHLNSINLFEKHSRKIYEEEFYFINKSQNEFACLDNKYFEENIYFGLNYYECLIRLYEKYNHINIRAFQLLCDHKKLMLERLDFLRDRKYIGNYNELHDICKDVESVSSITQNLVIKTELLGDSGIYKTNIIDKIKLMKEKDEVFTLSLFKSLKS